jgi:hypothetical protein
MTRSSFLRRAFVGLAIIALGCRRATPPAPAPSGDAMVDATDAAADASVTDAAADASTSAEDAALDADVDGPPTKPVVLGEPCAKSIVGYSGEGTKICVDGVIRGYYARARGIEHGGGFELLYAGKPKVKGWTSVRQNGEAELRVLVRGDTLFIDQIDCPRCVVVQGYSFVGSLAGLPDRDLRLLACNLLGKAGRGSELRRARDWKTLLAVDGPDGGVPSPECKGAPATPGGGPR